MKTGTSTPLFITKKNHNSDTNTILPSGNLVDQDVYLEQMIKQRLVPFINRQYKSDRYVFWPDLAPAHYARKVTSYLTEKKINFVSRVMSPANLPKTRSIEDFWGSLKLEVYENDWVAKDFDELKARIKQCLRKIDVSVVQQYALSVPNILDDVRGNGV